MSNYQLNSNDTLGVMFSIEISTTLAYSRSRE